MQARWHHLVAWFFGGAFLTNAVALLLAHQLGRLHGRNL